MNFISLKQFSASTGPRFNQGFATDRKKYTGTNLRNLCLKPSSRIVWHWPRTPTYFLTSYEVPSTQSCSYLNASRSKSWAPWAMCASSQQPTEKLWTSYMGKLQMWRNQKVYVCVFLLLNDETINAWMCTQQFFFAWMQTAVAETGCEQQVSCVRAQSQSVQWHVPWSMACFVPRPYHNQRVWSITLPASNVYSSRVETWLEQHFCVTDFFAKFNVQQHICCAYIRFWVSSHDVSSQKTSCMFFPQIFPANKGCWCKELIKVKIRNLQ